MELPDISKIVITPELTAEINKALKERGDYWDRREQENRDFTSKCRCHTGGICFFHTTF